MFKFTNKHDYLSQRQALLDEAEKMLSNGDREGADAKMDNVREMDKAYEFFAQAQANLRAMNGGAAAVALKTNSNLDNTFTDKPMAPSEMYASVEYRTAFMRNVLLHEAMPAQFTNANAVTKTTDVSVVIPTTIMQRIVERLEEHGHILKEITQTSYKGGLAVPTSTVKPVASWVAEGAGSDTQKKTLGSITFSYYKLRCAISVTLEVDTVTLDFFETIFVQQVTEAMVKGLETAVIKGSGASQPTGILTSANSNTPKVEIAKAASITYKDLWEMLKKIPAGYRNSVKWCMNYSTFCDLMALTDQQGQPIARVNYGLTGGAQAVLLGISVLFSDDVDAYAATVTSDTTVAFLYSFKDYILNTNLAMTVKQYEDNETENKVTKAVMLADGKCIDVNSLVLMTKKSS